MLGTMYRWCVAAFNNGLWNIPTPVDQVLDDRIVQMQVKIDALCEQQWPPEQHPRKKSEHMLYLLCYQGQLGTICLQEDSDHMCLWPGYHLHHDTAKHGHPGIMKESTGEWNDALLSSVMRVGSFFKRVMDVYLYGVGLVSVIFRRTGSISGFIVWGAISLNSRSHLVFLQSKVNSARHIVQAIIPVILSFIRQEGDTLFQQHNARPHTAVATQLVLRGVQLLPWPARAPDLSTIEPYWGTLKREFTLSPESAITRVGFFWC